MPVPPIDVHHLLLFLLQVGLLLALALGLGRLATRWGMPAVVGELTTGIVLGPSLLGQLAPGLSGWLMPTVDSQVHLLDAVAQLGVLLLVAVAGIEVDLPLVRRRAGTVAAVGGAGLVIPFGLGVAAGFLIPETLLTEGSDRLVFALFIGVALCVSALPVITKLLADLRLLHRTIGQLTLAAGIVDDVFGWFVLSVVAAMATTGARAGDAVLSLLALLLVAALAVTAGRPLVRAVLRRTERVGEAAPTVTAAVAIVMLCAAGTHALRLEAVFGAFVAGLLIRASGVDLANLAPLRVMVMAVLAPLFFAVAGLRMDLTALADPVVLAVAAGVLLLAVVGKFAGAGLGALASRLTRWEALALGAGLNTRGVIQIVVATVGLRLGVLGTETYTIVVLVAIATTLMAPPILRLAVRRIDYTAEEELRRQHAAAFAGERG